MRMLLLIAVLTLAGACRTEGEIGLRGMAERPAEEPVMEPSEEPQEEPQVEPMEEAEAPAPSMG